MKNINFDILNYAFPPGLTLLTPSLVGLFTGPVQIVNYFDVSSMFIMLGMSEEQRSDVWSWNRHYCLCVQIRWAGCIVLCTATLFISCCIQSDGIIELVGVCKEIGVAALVILWCQHRFWLASSAKGWLSCRSVGMWLWCVLILYGRHPGVVCFNVIHRSAHGEAVNACFLPLPNDACQC